MMFKAVTKISLYAAMAVGLCFSGTAQTTPAAPSNPAPAQGNSPGKASPKTDATGMSISGSLSGVNSNEIASLYGAPVVQIVARVNDRVITNSDVTRAQTQLDQDARQNNWSLEEYNRNQKNLLRDLIDQQLLLSKGKQLGISGDTDLIKRLDEIRKQNHLDSLDDLEKAVEQQGISYEDFKANIRNSIVTQQVVRDEVGSRMQISQAEIEKYYNEHKDSFTQPESVHLNEILIPTSENPSQSQLAAAEAKANDVEAKLKAGGKFTDLAKKYSGGPTAQEGGDLGQFKRGALAKVLEDQTFNLPPGAYTPPIRTKQGYIILQVSEHTPGGTQPLQKVEPQIEQAIYLEKIQPAVRRYLTRLREEAYIDIRPGYTDAAASPNETKPTFTAYAPPQPKKKKKKARFDKREVRYASTRGRKKTAAPLMTAAAAPAPVLSPSGDTVAPAVTTPAAVGTAIAAGATGATSRTAATAISSSRKKSTLKKQLAQKKKKRQKMRYGQAPNARVSDEQVASAADATAAGAPASAAGGEAAGNSDVQPLGPDLEHAPTITQPAKVKTRFSDEARDKAEMASRARHRKGAKVKKVKKVKVDNALATPLSTAEAANQNVQYAPLGLNGATADKKKKVKKKKLKGAEKTRLSDQKKGEQTPPKSGDNSAPQNDATPSSNSYQNGTPLPPPRQPS
jgi:peptidyl-prolyl cis-trans isomerase SurA